MHEWVDEAVIELGSQAEWAAWLSENHATETAVWLKVAKKRSGIVTVSCPEALDIALRYGWIDGQCGKLDDDYFLQRYSRRRRGSRWSRINRDRVEVLAAEGLMFSAGLHEVELAKANGLWDAAYASSKNMVVPDDLAAGLDRDPVAKTTSHLGLLWVSRSSLTARR